MVGTRILLVYRVFGPYHVARWRHWQLYGRALGWEPLALELFGWSDTYNWTSGHNNGEGILRFGLRTQGSDNLRWRDGARLWRLLDALAPDVLVVNGWAKRDALLMHLWCRSRRVPRILVSDSQAIDRRRNRVLEVVKRGIVRGSEAAFVAGGPHRRYLESMGFPTARTVLGCDVVDNAHFARPTVHGRCPGAGQRLLTVCRLVPSKNLIAAVESFGRFVAERPEGEHWEWAIAGYGPLRQEIRSTAERYSAPVRLLGSVDYDELPALHQTADLYWQPSLSEPWGLAVNEAMAAGRPVLVSERCGCREELVHDDNGWQFDPVSVESMRRALHVAADAIDAWPAMGARSADIVADWDLPRFSAGLEQAVRTALSAHAAERAA